jgi:hypothetical protein
LDDRFQGSVGLVDGWLPGAERLREARHVDSHLFRLELFWAAGSQEVDAFEEEAGVLFDSCGVTELDATAGPDDTVPGKGVGRVGAEEAGDGAVIERVAGGGGDFSVGADLAGWDGEDDTAEGVVAELVGAGAVAEDAALELVGKEGGRGGAAAGGGGGL